MPRSLSLCSCIIVASAMFSPVSAQVPGFPPSDWAYQSNLAFAGLGTCVAPAGDVNGDGYADVMISAPSYDEAKGLVLLFLGSPSGLSSSPNWSISGSIRVGYLSAREKTGDVNGDGFDDVLLNDGRLFFGSSSGVSGTFQTTDAKLFDFSSGDVNGDGYGDIAWYQDLWFGSPSGLSEHRWVKNVKGGNGLMLNDLTGDGYADIVLSSFSILPPDLRTGSDGTAALYLFAGGPHGMSRRETGPDLSWDSGRPFLQAAGDVDSDGFNDFLLAIYANSPAQSPDRAATPVYIMRGSDSGFIVPSSFFYFSTGLYQFNEMDDTGDINGDGYDDVLIVDGDDLGQRLHVFAGGPGGPTVPSATLEDLDRLFSWRFERVARGAGDVNGDGYDDLIVGYPGFSDGQAQEGRVLLFLGRPGFPSAAQGIP